MTIRMFVVLPSGGWYGRLVHGAGIAPKGPLLPIRAAMIALVVCLIGITAPTAFAAKQTSTIIDFSQAGQGPFDQSYFPGVQFTEGSFVGIVQGDEALIGPVAGSAKKKFTSISASFAPAAQGTAIYTLTAYKGKNAVGSTSVTVTQDLGDPETGPFGYATISLSGLPRADSFSLRNTFVRSSFPPITGIEFGTALISISG
jgi:hypothetical protein